MQTEMSSFVLKDFGRGVLKNDAICGSPLHRQHALWIMPVPHQ